MKQSMRSEVVDAMLRNPVKLAYSVPEFCLSVSLGRSKVYEDIKVGKLKARKSGKRILIRPF